MTVIIAVLLRNDDCLNKFKSSLVHSTSKRLLDFYKKKKLLHEASQYNSDDCVRVRS
jgi:ribosomal protein S15P/S13E